MTSLIHKGIFPYLMSEKEGNPQTVPTEASHSADDNSHYGLVPFPIWENFPFHLIFKVYIGSVWCINQTAFPEPKMLFLYIFLVSCCLPGSMGGAGDEFQKNLQDLVAQANEEVGRYLFFFISYSSFDGNVKWSLA